MGFTLQIAGDATGTDLDDVLDAFAAVVEAHRAGILSADGTRTDDAGTTAINLLQPPAPAPDAGDGSSSSGDTGSTPAPPPPAAPEPTAPPGWSVEDLAAFEQATNASLAATNDRLDALTTQVAHLADQLAASSTSEPAPPAPSNPEGGS